jgi:ABC-type multidrug transport system fused ATPase/permease subunit
MKVLSRSDKRKVATITILQVFMGTLDLLGVLAVGLLGALAVNSLQSTSLPSFILPILDIIHLSNSPFQTQALILGTGAVALLVGRTVLSVFFSRKILFFLSRRGATISANLISRLLSQSLIFVNSRTSQETLFAVSHGVSLITLQVLASAVVLVSDVSLLIIMAVGLFVVDPITSIGTFLVFFLVGYLLYRFMHVRADELGKKSTTLNIKSSEKIVEVVASYREAVVRNRRDFYARQIGNYRLELANVNAELTFLPYVSKYVVETSVIVGSLILGLIQFLLQDALQAVSTLAIFLAAGTRIAPAVLRVQQGSIAIRTALAQALPTLDLIDSLGNAPITVNVQDKVDIAHDGFVSEIQLDNLSFTYPGAEKPAISDVSIAIPAGASVAVVGPSGAGKTTLIDIILGVLDPDTGTVFISGLSPMIAVGRWPGAISYVPQDVVIAAGTIRENVSLAFPPEEASDELVFSALRVAHLEEFVSGLPKNIDTEVGERGAKISGGQRQRLGIARAMFTRPHLLVLDEATSSLDGETEAGIASAIHALRGTTTIVMIAHRLSTVRNADIVIYMSSGRVLATGTFEHVRSTIPDFDRQAKLMGL